ncbi:MAG: hypothetical protein A2821_00945 [Candidatus Magasanikbacteria bacterium RIFCSPHIGHO2_01_FULL_41_23]|uniref:Uncharacterized protein n=1 Tax=Candidatus Magasanikbacteria bacterium RIFCSPLOWO2_01_FULL_40_15 TaxID=1798686 RepID=A0A1F6N0H2_9BACT|nr:MAG: hypothetical protein A2821_00945 [Candidatus Magasanikbacteria bacterium RIFCSPHIGHO2_01_FULL_41_23]OGH74741.1 MAG: hypothetical protein A3F22_02300 [Candidatus Magasanikbacteria bacterium RIFCSPHIGHO2_12_FULL_41_16]OGH77455.1 MAG: hypothetical protein A2983_02000 [Candidatus Magasanikbacteria bacterium RIFCSPLOWO2_01_FULL_40_15]
MSDRPQTFTEKYLAALTLVVKAHWKANWITFGMIKAVPGFHELPELNAFWFVDQAFKRGGLTLVPSHEHKTRYRINRSSPDVIEAAKECGYIMGMEQILALPETQEIFKEGLFNDLFDE